jgi:predicted RNA-binding Zn-ribbon protein involved in translation (DUF1610 family)
MAIDHTLTRLAICPYCGYEHPDSWEIQESGLMDCESCEKEFHVEKQVEVSYTTKSITPKE